MATVTRQTPQASVPLARRDRYRIVLLDRCPKARVRCMEYFTLRCFRCFATDDLDEATRLRDAVRADAVVITGHQVSLDAMQEYQQEHCRTDALRPALYLLDDHRAAAMAPLLQPDIHRVISSRASLGEVRRALDELMELADFRRGDIPLATPLVAENTKKSPSRPQPSVKPR